MPGYNPQTCFDNLKSEGKPPCPDQKGGGLSYHCGQFAVTPAVHLACARKAIYTPVQYTEAYNTTKCGATEYDPVKCEEKTFANLSDLVNFLSNNRDFKARPCYCCCACYAWGTPIAVPAGEKVIQDFRVGDEVSVASVSSQGGALQMSWSSAEVHFSSGTPPLPKGQATYPLVVFLHYGQDQSLIVSQDEIFLLQTGKLKQANMLTVRDKLVASDGSPVDINAVKLGQYSGGLHHIATRLEYEGTVDGHLLSSNGVVSGDYTLQINPGNLGDMLETCPLLGTSEYEQENAQYAIGAHSYQNLSASVELPTPAHLTLFSGNAMPIPDDACSFITQPQEGDIIANRHIRPFSNNANKYAVQYIFDLYSAFYPDIQFLLDWENINPNAYAFRAYGNQYVLLSGGMVRVSELYEAGLAVIIAQAAAAFLNPTGSQPDDRLLPRIEADYYGIGVIMRTAWGSNWNTTVENGIAQVKSLFGCFSAEDAKGDPNHPLDDPSIQCREQAMEYAYLGGDLPPCAQLAP